MDPYGNVQPPYPYGYESEESASFDLPIEDPYAPPPYPYGYQSQGVADPYAPPPQGAYGNPVPPPYAYAPPPQSPYGGSGYDGSSSAFDGYSDESMKNFFK
ncbi:hypothetical protein CTI12_AA049460 [Artemisia annua]|uniref:Uncharacterized protein n=1 Tax=Artemisia annua TaxID=35608 RepID=A0A2U1QC47_ARTAN|nr:hypothetical protein CTI12_AA049460 [Artemisia annua]